MGSRLTLRKLLQLRVKVLRLIESIHHSLSAAFTSFRW